MSSATSIENPAYLPQASRPGVWRGLLTEPQREGSTRDWFKRFGLVTYFPSFARTARRVGGKPYQRRCAAIPGYLFLFEDLRRRDTWTIVHRAPTVHGVLRSHGNAPATLPATAIAYLRDIEDRLNNPILLKTAAMFCLGMKVRFTCDLYRHWTGSIGALADDGRIRVDDVSLFGCATSVWVRADEIEGCS